MKETEIRVNGMVCEGCENRIKNALKTLKGVEQVTANHESGIVTVIAKENIDRSVFEEKIEDIGFEIVK